MAALSNKVPSRSPKGNKKVSAPVAPTTRLVCKCGKAGRVVNTPRGQLFVCFTNPKHNHLVEKVRTDYCATCDKDTANCRYSDCTYCYVCWNTTLHKDKPKSTTKLVEVRTPKPKTPGGVRNSRPIPRGRVVTTEVPRGAEQHAATPVSDIQVEEVSRKVLKKSRFFDGVVVATRQATQDFRNADEAQRSSLLVQSKRELNRALSDLPRMINIRVGGVVRSFRPRLPVRNGPLTIFNVAALITIDGAEETLGIPVATNLLQDLAYWSKLWDLGLLRVKVQKRDARAKRAPRKSRVKRTSTSQAAPVKATSTQSPLTQSETTTLLKETARALNAAATQSPKPQRAVKAVIHRDPQEQLPMRSYSDTLKNAQMIMMREEATTDEM